MVTLFLCLLRFFSSLDSPFGWSRRFPAANPTIEAAAAAASHSQILMVILFHF